MGPNILIPSVLVFGTMTTIPTPTNPNPAQAERFRDLALASSEMKTRTAENCTKIALRIRLPPATHYLIRPGDKVRVYRESTGCWNYT